MRQKPDQSVVAERLRYLRTMAGLNQNKLADLLGIPRGTYVNYENRSVPGEKLLQRLADIYGVDPRVFYGEEGESLMNMQGRLNDPSYEAARGLFPLPEDERALLVLYRLLDKDQQAKLIDELSESLRNEENKK